MKKLLLTGVAMMALTSACAVGPDFVRPGAPGVKRLTETDMPQKTSSSDNKAGAAQVFETNKAVSAEWWKLFGSPQLDALMAQAIAANPDLQAAKASLTQAHETYLASRGELLPTVDADLGANREKISTEAFGIPGGSKPFNLYNASVDVSYNLDIFGGTRREIEALAAQVDYQRYEWQAAYLALTANVATTAIQEASLREQIKETNSIIAIQREQLDLLDKQLALGAIARTAFLEQQTLVAQTEATLPPLEKQLAQTRNALAILVGKLPGEGMVETFDLSTLHLPEELPVSLPSELVNQRPDIRAAEALLKAANAEVGVATANMLPNVTLSGSYGGESTGIHSVFTPETLVWDMGAKLLQPLFHGGELLHAKRSQVAAYDKANAQYRSTVLTAFKNVADTLRALQYDAGALGSNVKAEKAASDTYNLYHSQYDAGAITYSQMLDIQRTLQQTRISLVQAQAARFADTVALYQSLGGNWSQCEEPAKFTMNAAAPATVPTVAAPAVTTIINPQPLAATSAPGAAQKPFILLPPANPEPQSTLK